MTHSVYQRCNRCVMDTSDLEIVFDDNGYCNHCNDYLSKTMQYVYKGKESDDMLADWVNKMKIAGKGSNYDCLIGISGGIDSCYATFSIKKLGLRALVVHMDNGWNSDISVKNIKHVVNKLGYDYQSYVLDWEEFRDLQLAFLRASVPEAETPTDIAIPAALHKIAAENKIKYIISGGNYATEGILPKGWHYDAKDVTYLKAIQKKFGTKKLKSFPLFGYRKEMYYKIVKGMRFVYLLNYLPYSKSEAMRVLESELGWTYYGGKHYESKYTGFLQSYILPKKFNIDYRLATLSTQICAGEVTREFALDKLKTLPYDPIKSEEEKQYICKKLKLSVSEFDMIMNDPPKSYKDYPNNKWLLEFIYSIYRKIKPNK